MSVRMSSKVDVGTGMVAHDLLQLGIRCLRLTLVPRLTVSASIQIPVCDLTDYVPRSS